MSEEWVEATLGDVLCHVKDLVGTSGVDLVLSVTEKRGILPQDQVFRKRIATNDLTKYKVLRPLDIAYNPYLLWTGAVGQWLGLSLGATSPVYECFRARDGVAPRFVGLVLESGKLTDYFDSTAVGSIQRRRRTTPQVFLAAPISVPPLPVQRRIVDLMAHLDNHLANLRAEREAAVDVLSRAAVERLCLPGDSGTPLSDLLLRNIGGVWGENVGTGDQTVDVFRSTEFTDLGYLSARAGARRDVAAGQLASRELAVGDVLVEKSGGTPTRSVGRVVRLESADLVGPAVGANFLQLLRVNPDLADPGYVFWILWAAHRRGDAFGFQQASTNIRNLKTKEYLGRRVDLPTRQNQAEIAAELDSILLLIRGLGREINGLTLLRGQLLSDLLSGSVEMPGNYDQFLSAVA